MRIGLLGGLSVDHRGEPVIVTGAMQLAVLFRLAVDAGTAVAYRALAEDVWSLDAPENSRAALQSIVSRLRTQLPAGSIESVPGGYRLAVSRADVDALVFSDLVAAAALSSDPAEGRRLAVDAIALWTGDPWIPSESFDWFDRDLRRDHALALDLAGRAASGSAPRSTIPVPLTAIVGRERELESIVEQRRQSRLVTVIGSGGAGKTRLALEAAAGVAGAILVELAPVGPTELYAAVASALGRDVRTADSGEPIGSRDRILDALAGRDCLLVVDNCEHVIDAAAALAEDLLGALPLLSIVATSREPLGVPGEAFVSLGPLAHPTETDLAGVTAERARGFDAVELFRQRARAATGSELADADLLIAARIVFRLDGLPLAIELAAAKLRSMSPDEVLAGLDDRFTLLTGGFRTALPRHQTLRAMIDWSWSLLSDDERVALSRIAVFPAGVGIADAGQVAGALGIAAASVFDSLVDRSLLQRSRGRYRALETIREYGIERLAAAGELADARAAQVRSLGDRAVEFDARLRRSTVRDAIAWFDAEDDNIAAGLRYAIEGGLAGEAARLATACLWYWTIRDRSEDSQHWFVRLLALVSGGDTAGEPSAAEADGPESDGPEADGPEADDPVAEATRAAGPAPLVETAEIRLIRSLAPVVDRIAARVSPDSGRDAFSTEGVTRPPIASAADLAAIDAAVGDEANELVRLIPPLLRSFASVGLAEEWMLRARLPRGEDLGLPAWSSALLHVLRAAMAHNRGELVELGEETALAVAQFEKIGDVWGLALAQQLRAEWLSTEGRLDEAFAMTEISTGNMRRITTSWDLAQQQSLAVSILLRQGRRAEAHERLALLLGEAEESGNARALLQVQITGMQIAIADRDPVALGRFVDAFDGLVGAWPTPPAQLTAWAEAGRGSMLMFRGDLERAEQSLRQAVDAALASHDRPVIGMVATAVGSLALERGDYAEALRAVDLATAITGYHDAHSPQVRAIESAAAEHDARRAGAGAPTRRDAIESLGQILRR